MRALQPHTHATAEEAHMHDDYRLLTGAGAMLYVYAWEWESGMIEEWLADACPGARLPDDLREPPYRSVTVDLGPTSLEVSPMARPDWW